MLESHRITRRFTLLATVKNEAPFLLEWIAYHKAIGFDTIIIYSNDSSDGTTELLSALHDLGEIIHIYHNPSPNVSIVKTVARAAAACGHLELGDWLIWLDADEFLNVHVGARRVSDLADVVQTNCGAQGICISWRLFGSSGNTTFNGSFISDDFLKCDARSDRRSNNKTFFVYDGLVKELSNHKPQMKDDFWCDGRGFLGSNGSMMRDTDRYVRRWRNGETPGRISQNYTSWDIAQINHYAVRTPELTRLKRKRGRIGKAQSIKKLRYGQGYFRNYDRNEGMDRSILKWEDETLERYFDLVSKVSITVDYFQLIREKYDREVVCLQALAKEHR